MNIGEAARESGVSPKMIRHYESIGLMPSAERSLSGYRVYSGRDVEMLRFVRAARDLGFGLDVIGELISLWRNHKRESRAAKAVTLAHIKALEKKAAEINRMITVLKRLSDSCPGDHRPDCPILEALSQAAGTDLEPKPRLSTRD